jgi:hypothetical protein
VNAAGSPRPRPGIRRHGRRGRPRPCRRREGNRVDRQHSGLVIPAGHGKPLDC